MRLRIGLGLWVVAGLALALKIRLLKGLVGEETLRTIVAIDAAATVLLFLFALATLTSHLSAVREILRSLVSFVGGRREQRVPVQGSALLQQLGQIINEVLVEIAGDDEMSSRTPGFRRVVRPKDATDPKLRAQILAHTPAETEAVDIDGTEGVGPVRVRRRDQGVDTTPARPQTASAPELETQDTEVGPALAEPCEPPRDVDANVPSTIDVDLASQVPAAAAEAHDVVNEEGAPPDAGSSVASAEIALAAGPPAGSATAESEPDVRVGSSMASGEHFAGEEAVEHAPAQEDDDPLTAERRALFESFLSAKKVLGENIDEVDFGDFVDEVTALRAQIMADRACDDVRFEVKVVDGQVALQPRIVRAKASAS